VYYCGAWDSSLSGYIF
nr:immunoglobulin light chain junction region [Macaca mulatta]MOV66046.1 immunoglobulin light chain junction region [Macaca mulatta]MOV67418.1 immunoglobulin light chain junction region [Macaca mulatta]MOV68091.1 immunoglobulin light chain junction region [Macaca mulatta]MOV68142.1 immunoglobulin light chain junction region [Macaca mulatta]